MNTAPQGSMHPAYFETHFRQDDGSPKIQRWPERFAIITAWATTGEHWSEVENVSADQQLKEELQRRSTWCRRLTGYSPQTGHAEPGWAVELDFDTACDIGHRYRQDAIYYVEGDELYVSYCDQRRSRVPVGPFRTRLTGPN